MREVSLSKDELDRLKDGESVRVKNLWDESVEIHPPCEESGHEWSGYTLRKDRDVDGDYNTHTLRKSCKKCGTVNEVKIDPEPLF